jgi:hypothetical protein
MGVVAHDGIRLLLLLPVATATPCCLRGIGSPFCLKAIGIKEDVPLRKRSVSTTVTANGGDRHRINFDDYFK